MTTVQWMWADASIVGHGAARLNPLRWSTGKSVEETISDLERITACDRGRPITVRLQERRPSRKLEQNFSAGVDPATSWLKGQLPPLQSTSCVVVEDGSVAAAGAAVEPDTPEVGSQLPLAVSSRICESAVEARWMWDDVGLAPVLPAYRRLAEKNPLRWAPWKGLEETAAHIEVSTQRQDGRDPVLGVVVERPVALEVRRVMQDGECKSFVSTETVTAALATLSELIALGNLIAGRDEFPPVSEATDFAESEYGKYVLRIVGKHGGYIGSAVRFSSQERFAFVAHGQDGVIEEFHHDGAVKVNWGSHSAMVSMVQCTLIETADKKRRLSGISPGDVQSALMRQIAARLRSAAKQPEFFERTCVRLVTGNEGPRAGCSAAEHGVCEVVVEVMSNDGCATQSMQKAGCMVLCWVCLPRGDITCTEEARVRAVKAGALSAAAKSQNAFPDDAELLQMVRGLAASVAEGSPERRQMALASGICEEWLRRVE